MKSTYVVHYSEIALKGKNRPVFARLLRYNLRRALAQVGKVAVHESEGRLVLDFEGDESDAEERIAKVFGVAWFARASIVPSEYDSIREEVVARAESHPGGTFRITARRTDKSFPIGSQELATRLGGDVVSRTGRTVSLSEPDLAVNVDVLKGMAMVYSSKSRGPGGLPVGTSGRVLHLFSGGIDSPVAAWLMMKRGCRPVYLHFYLAPTPEYAIKSKVIKEVRRLSDYSGKSTVVLVPFAQYQIATTGVPGDLEPSLFRRFMRVTAESLAAKFGASAISTGDCLAQAASQTVWNLGVFDEGSSLPILRPLLAYDKEEVIQLARKIGTYEVSLEEYKDCCAIVTRHPKTRAKRELISQFAERLAFDQLARESVDAATLVSFDPATGSLKASPLKEMGVSAGVIPGEPGEPLHASNVRQ
ncbi:MAG: tRNA 4-thiouridine(8) synthase ThiI [Thaumarchaeota archaeon]|nr:tRNA 4-thiouridine(8) synthase ThiI [Nitrososphaerota archaeon]